MGAAGRRPAQAMVEFALTLPLVLILMMGVLDLGRGVLTNIALSNSVREGARTAIAVYPASGWDTQAVTRTGASAAILDLSALTVTATTETSGGSTYVRVTGQYQFRLIAPYLTITRSTILLNSTTRMLVS